MVVRGVAAACVAVVVGLSAEAATAEAARFTSRPSAAYGYSWSGAGPFAWTFVSGDPGGPNGRVAYKLSTEPGWHRCVAAGAASLANLPDGRYGISIADDVDPDWYADHGLADDEATLPCREASSAPPSTPITQSGMGVDGTPPTLTFSLVSVVGTSVVVRVDATDATSGVRRIEWSAGVARQSGQFFRHTFPSYGSHSVGILVVDNAGNRIFTSYWVHLKHPRERVAPTVTVNRVMPNVLRGGAMAVDVSVSEGATISATATVRLGRRTYRFDHARLPFISRHALRERHRLTLGAPAALRRAVRRALRRDQRVVARLQVNAVDRWGNRRAIRRLVRLTV